MLTFTVQLYIYRLKIKSKLQICNNLILNNYLFFNVCDISFLCQRTSNSPYSAPGRQRSRRKHWFYCGPRPPTSNHAIQPIVFTFCNSRTLFFLCFMELIENEWNWNVFEMKMVPRSKSWTYVSIKISCCSNLFLLAWPNLWTCLFQGTTIFWCLVFWLMRLPTSWVQITMGINPSQFFLLILSFYSPLNPSHFGWVWVFDCHLIFLWVSGKTIPTKSRPGLLYQFLTLSAIYRATYSIYKDRTSVPCKEGQNLMSPAVGTLRL